MLFVVGHHRLQKITAMDREEMKKREKEQRRRKEEEDDPSRLIWIKYPLGLKHQVSLYKLFCCLLRYM